MENYRIVEASAKLLGRFCSGEKQVTVEYRERGQNGKLMAAKNCANVSGYCL